MDDISLARGRKSQGLMVGAEPEAIKKGISDTQLNGKSKVLLKVPESQKYQL